MEIIVIDPTYDHPNRDREKFIEDLKNYVLGLSNDVQLNDTDIGRAASLPGVLLIIGGLFFLGDKINKNLEAWTSLAKKFKMFLVKIGREFGGYRIDETGATLLAIERILNLEQGSISSIEKICGNILTIYPLMVRELDGLNKKPDALYVQIFKVNENSVYIFGIKSKGLIEIEYKINTADWMGF